MIGIAYVVVLLGIFLGASRGLEIDRTYSFEAPITSDGHTLQHWDVFGSASLETDRIILTPPSPANAVGAVWSQYTYPHSEWAVDVQFLVAGNEGPPKKFGPGWVLWYTEARAKSGRVFGGEDKWAGLALALDGYGANGKSMIRAHVNDGSVAFAAGQSIGSCPFEYRNTEHSQSLKVSYRGELLRVDVNEQLCFETTLTLPANYYFGLSAQSGETKDAVQISKLVTSRAGPAEGLEADQQEKLHQESKLEFQTTQVDTLKFEDIKEYLEQQRLLSHKHKEVEQKLLEIVAHLKPFTDFKYAIERLEQRFSQLIEGIQSLESRIGSSNNQQQPTNAHLERLTEEMINVQSKIDKVEKALDEHTSSLLGQLPDRLALAGKSYTGVIITVSVQLLLAACFIYYKKRRSNMPKKFL